MTSHEYVLVPVPNLQSPPNWGSAFQTLVLLQMEVHTTAANFAAIVLDVQALSTIGAIEVVGAVGVVPLRNGAYPNTKGVPPEIIMCVGV